MNPTREQIQWLWEQCGIKYEPDEDEFKVIFPDGEWYNFGHDWKMDEIEPEIDLNSLFKYAVPKLDIERINLYPATKDRWGCYFDNWYQDHNVGETPALALFWATYKAFGGVNE